MRKVLKLSLVATLLGALFAGCSGGGASNSMPSSPTVVGTPGRTQQTQSVSFTVKIPKVTSSAIKRPAYVPSTTQSVSVTETDNGGTANPPVIQNVTPGSAGCTTSTSGTTCTIAVQAAIGNDQFTVKCFDQTNAGGNLLASGTVEGIVKSGEANSFPLTLGGTVSGVTLTASDLYPPIGQSTMVFAEAKDADGNIIIGPYDAPVSLTTSGAANLSVSQFNSSADAATAQLATSQTQPFTIDASVSGHSASLTITPASNTIAYNVGSGSNDIVGFQVTAGIDGNLYYTTLTPSVCGNGMCTGSSGNIGRFDPSTGNFTEIAATGEAIQAYQTADGAVWASVSGGKVARIAGGFSQANYTDIPLPVPSATPRGGDRPRNFALGSDGNLYLTGNSDHSLYVIPPGGPYTTAAITRIGAPQNAGISNPYCTCAQRPYPEGIAADSAGNLWYANNAMWSMSATSYSPGSTTFSNYPLASWGEAPRFMAAASDGNLYMTSSDMGSSQPQTGGLFKVTTGGAITSIGLPDGNSQPDAITSANGRVAFADLGTNGFGTYDTSTGELRDYTVYPLYNGVQSAPVTGGANGVAFANDGSLWFLTYGALQAGGSLAMEHVVLTDAWNVFPSRSMTMYGAGEANQQLVGILEKGNSGPFTLSTSNPAVASLQPIAGFSHDFHLVGSGPGACTVTITDAHGRSVDIAVSVTTTTGTVQAVGRSRSSSKKGYM